MRQFQLALLSAIFVVLCVIAFQLSRLAADFQLGADVRSSILSLAAPTPAATETRAQRVDRRAREVNRILDEMKDGAKENTEVDTRAKQLRAEQAHKSR